MRGSRPRYTRSIFRGRRRGYAFSLIDLVPATIPVLVYLDDLVLASLGITLAVGMIPPDVLAEWCTEARMVTTGNKPIYRVAAVVVIVVWVFLAALAVYLVARW